MELKDYLLAKEKGVATLSKVGGKNILIIKRFSPVTGEESEPAIQTLDIEDLRKKKELAQSVVSNIDALITDIEEL